MSEVDLQAKGAVHLSVLSTSLKTDRERGLEQSAMATVTELCQRKRTLYAMEVSRILDQRLPSYRAVGTVRCQ